MKNVLIISSVGNVYIKNIPNSIRKTTLIKYLSLIGEKIQDDKEIKYYKNKEIDQYLFQELGELKDIYIEELFDRIFEWKDLKEAI